MAVRVKASPRWSTASVTCLAKVRAIVLGRRSLAVQAATFLLKADKRAPTSVRKFGDEQLETIPLPNGVNVTIKRAALANGLQVGSNTCKRRRNCGRACGGTGGGSSCRRR